MADMTLRQRPPPPPWLRLIGIALTPTRAIVDLCRHFGKLRRGRSIMLWNSGFQLALLIHYILTLWGRLDDARNLILWAVATVAFWRVNELIYAFYRDAMDRIERYEPRSRLADGTRVRLLLVAYAEIVAQFGAIHYVLMRILGPNSYDGLGDIISALYFSGITITTTGFGDIKPNELMPRAVTVFEASTGVCSSPSP